MEYLGEISALAAALVWALATWIYSQFSHQFSAMQLNIVKGVIASAMMFSIIPFMPLPERGWVIESEHILILAFSGVIGIAIGDSAYFAALKRLGANKTLLLESLAPPLSGVLALIVLEAELSVKSWLGVVITTAAVAFVVFRPSRYEPKVSKVGIGFGILASICQASGVVISHYALVAGDIPPLWGAFIRLSIGVLVVILVIQFFEPTPFSGIKKHWNGMISKQKGMLFMAIFVGTFLALWLQQIALKNSNPAIAQTLIATSPLFILLIYAWRGEKVSSISVIGTLAAVGGISLFFL